jgi:hypothetical protein
MMVVARRSKGLGLPAAPRQMMALRTMVLRKAALRMIVLSHAILKGKALRGKRKLRFRVPSGGEA